MADVPAAPWRTEGLFSRHFLTQRLPQPGSPLWPDVAEANAAFDAARALFVKNEAGLAKGNEEDCEDRFLAPLLDLLGFGYQKRRKIPGASATLLPDFLLYASPEAADAPFLAGKKNADGYYADCIGLLEAKKWRLPLSQENATGKSKGRSPHQQLRDYLNETDRVNWGVLTNGAEWRLYARQARASTFFEFDLRQCLASPDEPAARRDFHLFFALFRRAMFERSGPGGATRLDAVQAGAQQFREEVERRLRVQVFECVEVLAGGFLDNADNGLSDAHLPAIYENTLILLYRILFVLNAEARGLLPTQDVDKASREYVHAFGLDAVRRKLAEPALAGDYESDATFGLHGRLRDLFALINGRPGGAPGKPDKNEQLGIPRYNGGLFDPARYPFLETKRVADRYLARALKTLTFRTDQAEVVSFDYAGLGERHLGSVYEGLLEHRLGRDDASGTLSLRNDKGERKAQGAYFTPAAWVAFLVEETLRPLLDRIEASAPVQAGVPDSFAQAVLALNVCDPAMGSGHFLVEATSVLAEAVAAHLTTAPRPLLGVEGVPVLSPDTGEPLYTQEAKLAYWKRRVVEACIYGVDLNPLAVELAKLSLWLKTVDRVPLNFLDHHLRCGNSLLGTSLAALPHFPDPARKAKAAKKGAVVQLPLTFAADLIEAVGAAIAEIGAIEGVATDTHRAAKEKEERWRKIAAEIMPRFQAAADLWMAPYFGGALSWVLYQSLLDDADATGAARSDLDAVLGPLRFFHWQLEFPDIFFDEKGNPKATAGFDALVGNPPWERIKLAENEFFGARSTAIALAPRASDRKRLIAALPTSDPDLWTDYLRARTHTERVLAFAHRSGFYPLMGRGDTNLYALFAEKALGLVNPGGRVGLLVPSGIATDDTTKAFFQHLVTGQCLSQLFDFENKRRVFEDVDSRFKFSALVMTGEADPQNEVRCGFYLHGIEDLADAERTFTLSPADFATFNPNTLTCPIFRRRRDVELTRKIYQAAPVLVEQARGAAGNPWGVRFSTMFHMTNDSGLFQTAAELDAAGFWLGAGNVYTKGKVRCLPLYEGKMVQMYDHRAAGVSVNAANLHRAAQEAPSTPAERADPDYSPRPQFWVEEERIKVHFSGTAQPWLLGYKDVTAPTNARTMIPAAIPFSAVGNTFCLVRPGPLHPRACLLANLSAFVLDFAARQKVGGQHLNFFIVEQLPVLPPERYAHDFHGVRLADFITARVLELCYTAHDLKGLADDLGHAGPPFAWDEERRLHVRCQLDALFFLLYGLSEGEAGEILDTFPIVRRQDEARFGGRFRTRDLILGYLRAYAAGNLEAWVKA